KPFIFIILNSRKGKFVALNMDYWKIISLFLSCSTNTQVVGNIQILALVSPLFIININDQYYN
ncbi:hypothetical protein ACJX0J_024843, partial [Zea mays]